MPKCFLLFFVVVALITCEEEEIHYDDDHICTFTGSWFFKGQSVDQRDRVSQFGSGSVRIYENHRVCFMELQLVTPFSYFCNVGALVDKYANYMTFDNFQFPASTTSYLYSTIYITGENRIALQIEWQNDAENCRDYIFGGSSVRGDSANEILAFCANDKPYFDCAFARRRSNATRVN